MTNRLCVVLAALLFAGCADTRSPGPATPSKAEPPAAKVDAEPPPSLTPVALTALPGWADGDVAPTLAAFQGVCKRFSRKPPASNASKTWPELGSAAAWAAACAEAKTLGPEFARAFFTRRFDAFQVGDRDSRGLFTGYFEPEVPGSRRRGGANQTPLYQKPEDIVSVDLGAFSEDLKGKSITGRVVDGRLKPYHPRSEIAAGALAGRGLELVWLADPVDGFFIEIQGSGRISLAEGGAMRVGYAGKNGRSYRAIGRDLIANGAVRREDMSMQAIRAWLAANPDQAQAVMNLNKSVVFFEERKGRGPIGAAGAPLTPGYSLAIDPKFAPLGGLVYLDAPHPDPAAPPIRRLVVAEDTGGAIKGPIRGDLFWGTGAAAGELAGRMASQGRYFLLAPKAR